MGIEQKEQVQSRVPPGVYEDVQEYMEEHNCNESEAVKELLKDALEQRYRFDDLLIELATSCGALAMGTGVAAGVGLVPILAGSVVSSVLLTFALMTIAVLYYIQ